MALTEVEARVNGLQILEHKQRKCHTCKLRRDLKHKFVCGTKESAEYVMEADHIVTCRSWKLEEDPNLWRAEDE